MCLRVKVIFVECAKIKRRKNQQIFLIARISGMVEGIFFKFGMWPPLSGQHLRIRHHGAVHICENYDFVLPVNVLTVLHAPLFLVINLFHNLQTTFRLLPDHIQKARS